MFLMSEQDNVFDECMDIGSLCMTWNCIPLFMNYISPFQSGILFKDETLCWKREKM